MEERFFPITFWNYNVLRQFGPDEIAVWKDLGITVGMVPRFKMSDTEAVEIIKEYLKEAERLGGIKLMLWVEDMTLYDYGLLGEEKFREKFTQAYNTFKSPALYGFFAGDEPNERHTFEGTKAVVRIEKEIAPELDPYINFGIDLDKRIERCYPEITFDEWMKDFCKQTNLKHFCYGHYDQMVDEKGVDSHFRNLKATSEVAEKYGVEFWLTALSSAHYMFRIPTEYELLWQITTSVACGCKGISWFRLHDRWHSPANYHGSPIDEYGNKGETYIRMLHANRHFHDEYGSFVMGLKRKETYFTKHAYSGYTTLPYGKHHVIQTVRSTENGIVSFFEDENGTEYLVMVNASMEKAGVFRPEFDRDKYTLTEIRKNDKEMCIYGRRTTYDHYDAGHTENHWDGIWLYPGQLTIYRIGEK